MTPFAAFIPGILSVDKDCDDVRDFLGIPVERWVLLDWNQFADENLARIRMPAWKRPFWRKFGDALAWGRVRRDAIPHMRRRLEECIPEGEVILIAHSWGGVALVDLLESLAAEPLPNIRIVKLITACTPVAISRDLSQIEVPEFGWRHLIGRLDPISLEIGDEVKDNPRVLEETVWGPPRWNVHSGPLKSEAMRRALGGGWDWSNGNVRNHPSSGQFLDP